MRSIRLAVTLVLAAPMAGVAQSTPPAANSVAAQDSTPSAPKKKGGLFGKMKGLTKSKLVNTVAKTALCTAVPGGSMIAGAIDAKKAKNAKGAAAAAANMAGGGSTNCMPGMGMAQKAVTPSPAAAVAGVGVPGMPTTGIDPAAVSASQMGAMPSLTPEQLKQMEEQYKKMGISSEQIQAMQRQMQGMQQMSAPQAGPPQTSSPAPHAVGQPVITSESQGLVLRGLPWIPGSDEIRPDARASFGLAMRDLASGIQGSGKHYRVEARVESQGKKSLERTLSRKRAAAVVAGLVAEGIPAKQLKAADGASDKDARILLHESK
jgi:outer membrane protein OmpA-like peptidoglycan-associated protein